MKKITSALFTFFTLIGAFLGLTACGNTPSGQANPNHKPMNHPPDKNDSIKPSYSAEEISHMLNKLASTPVKKDLQLGAMCYSRVAPRDTSAYVCPVCGSKTLYQPHEFAMLRLQIPQCRSMMKLMPVDFSLDERQFCSHCTPDRPKAPALCLKVKLSDQPEHMNCGISETDLEVLLAFFKGSLTRMNETGGEIPMQDEIGRIRNLLGIKE